MLHLSEEVEVSSKKDYVVCWIGVPAPGAPSEQQIADFKLAIKDARTESAIKDGAPVKLKVPAGFSITEQTSRTHA